MCGADAKIPALFIFVRVVVPITIDRFDMHYHMCTKPVIPRVQSQLAKYDVADSECFGVTHRVEQTLVSMVYNWVQ